MIIASNQPNSQAISIYCRRWEIESLFQGLKGRGLQFENTRLVQSHKLEKLMALMAIAFAWAHKVSEWQAAGKPLRFKQFCNS